MSEPKPERISETGLLKIETEDSDWETARVLAAEVRRLRGLIVAEYEASDNWSTTPAHRDEAIAIRAESANPLLTQPNHKA